MATSSDLIVTRWGARFGGLIFPCAVGRGGIGVKVGEGDGITPAGSFAIKAVFVRTDRVNLAGTPIRPFDVWSDDPNDPNYNTRQSEWFYPFGHERLRRPDSLYDIVCDLDYNRGPIVSGKGSAIFLHVWRKPRYPTEGCIALAFEDLHWILTRWTPNSRVIVKR